jgi:hypothetical protein
VGQNQPANRVDDPGGDEYPCGYTVDPERVTDPAGLLLGVRDIGFVEINDIWRQRGPVCQLPWSNRYRAMIENEPAATTAAAPKTIPMV